MDTWQTKAHSFMLVSFIPNTPAGHEISNAPAPVQSEQRDASSQTRSFFSPSLPHHHLSLSAVPEHQKPNYSNDNLRCICTPILAMCEASLIYFDFTKRSALTPKCLCQASTRTLLAGFPLLKAGPKLAMMAFKQADHPKCRLDPLQYLDSEKNLDGLEEWIDMNQHVIPTPSHKIHKNIL